MAVLNSFERAADLFAAGFVDAGAIITHRHALADYPAALHAFASGQGLKHQVVP